MNQFLSNKIIAGIVAVALLVGVGVLVSSGDTSSTTRNAALVVATPCTKPGQVTKVSRQSVVCATTNSGSLWYAIMKAKGKAQPCAKPGAIRKKSKIVWVCGVIKKKKLWQATRPLSALAAKGDLPSTTPATPDAPIVADNAVLADPAAIDTAATQTLAPAVPATLSLVTQPLGGVNAVALETQPVVQLLDQRGASISTAGITITAVSGRTDVELSGNTAVTDATGRATFKTLSLTGIMGDITLTFTASGLEGIMSGNLVLAAGAATQLVISSTTGSVVSGKAFDQQPVLHFEDSSANVIAASGTDVIVTSSSQGLSGTTTVATNKKGIAGFTDLALTQAGATTLTFTSGELSTTTNVTVVAGDYTTVKITTEASQAASNNTAFSQSPVVQLVDANNNKVATAGITVTVTITQFPASDTDKVATLLINTTATDTQGVATFTGLGIEGLIGKYTLGYTPTNGATQASEKTTTLSAGVATQLIVRTAAAGPVGDNTAGAWSLTQSPVIGLRDISNNPVTTSGVTVTATVDKQTQTFEADTDDQGKATIQLIFSGDSAGDRTITYSAVDLGTTKGYIFLPLLTPVVMQAILVPTDKNTSSSEFTLAKPASSSDGAWTFTRSPATFVSVDTFGTVTLTGVAGRTTIRATQAATTKYRGVTATADLEIALTPAVVSPAWVLPTGTTTTSQAFTLPAPTSNSNAPWTYASSNTMIATITTTGAVTLKGVAGTTVVTATQAATTKYASTTSEATLNIAFTIPTVSWVLPKRIKSAASFTLTAPTSNSNAPWTYTSSNATIATITTAGVVTLTGVAGTTIITATQAATTKFASATKTGNLVATDGYNVGDVGPGGGKVFYDAGTTQSWGRYLEAAPTDYQVNNLPTKVGWGCQGTITGATATAIGTGKANTATILTKCTWAGAAADVANKYSTSTAAAGQWFLPSIDELNELCKMYSNGRTDTTQYATMQNGCTGNSSPTGGFAADSYWSSSESNTFYVLHQSFLNGYQSNSTKSTTYYVRPVRAFSATCAMGGPCAVGDVGPGGGTVFYDAGSTQSWGRYLEAAPTDYQVNDSGKEVEWGCSSTGTGVGAGATAIGTGKANTTKIIANCATAGIAADVANKYSTSTAGAGQWFLPSKDELNAMWTNRDAIGGFADDYYWSSSESPPYGGWFQIFPYGDKYVGGKYWAHYVRPVRAF